jgi:general secretion pathway protein A
VYESFYGFTEKPFNLTPDPKYLYLSARHSEAFAHLEFGRRERGGFVVITGEVGTGKTTLARYFLSGLGEHAATAVVLYPALTAAELLRSILDDLHVEVAGASLKDLVDALHRFLLDSRAKGKNVVLLIDEAQDLSAEVLEQIRLISNLETDTEKLIQIVLMGQSELQELLARRELRQLAQRVTARYHLAPLDRQEAEAYIRHRLRVAGGEGKLSFTPGALKRLHREAAGVPRLINLICDRALLAGYVQGTRTIDAPIVKRAAREVRGDAPGISRSLPLPLAAAALAALAFAALFWLRGDSATAVPRLPASPLPAASPAPAPSPVEPLASLEPLISSVPREASLAAALDAVQRLWGALPLERTPLRTHLDQVRRLDLPVVLEMFHPSRRDTCFVALLRVEGDAAMLGDGAGGTRRVALRDVDRLWTRQALFLWHDAASLDGGRDTARAAAFARDSLGQLGYLGQDPDLASAVMRFQHDAELTADGVIGNRTLMALYSLGRHPRPHLGGNPS